MVGRGARVRIGVALAVAATLVAMLPAIALAADTDGDIAGAVSLGTSPITGHLNADADDEHDVYKVYLSTGQRLTLSLSAYNDQTDFDLYLYPPGSSDIYGTDYVARGATYDYPEQIVYTATSSGFYYVDVDGYFSTAGYYRLTWTREYYTRKATTLAISASSQTPDYGDYVTLTAKLRVNGVAVADRAVTFQRYSASTRSWVSAGTATTGANGNATKEVLNSTGRAIAYRAKFAGDGDYRGAYSATYVTVKPKVYLSTPDGPYSPTPGKSMTIYGYLKPRHTSGTYPVVLYKQVWSGGKWVNQGSTKARVVNYSGYSKYSASVYLPKTYSSVRWRAYHASDAYNAATYSDGYLKYNVYTYYY